MRILTIGPSPHLLTRNGRIMRDIMLSLSAKGHHVEGLVWHHDVEYFLPNEINQHLYQGKTLYPYLGEKGGIAPFAFETMKVSQPNVVITVGDYDEVEWVWAIKSLYPNLFKWVAIIPSGTGTVSERSRIPLAYADRILVTTKEAYQAFAPIKTELAYIPYGADVENFHIINENEREFKLLSMGKNSQLSNVPAYLKALSETGFKGSLHTNIDDDGDYDLRGMIKRLNLKDSLSLPTKYVSVREGLTDALVNELYNDHSVVCDCSLQSQTALTTLEAMSAGCIPIGMEFGAVGEILRSLPQEFRFSVPFETFVGPKEEELAVISVKELVHGIRNIHRSYASDSGWVKEAKSVMSRTARNFSKEKFITNVSEILETVVTCGNFIAVDSF